MDCYELKWSDVRKKVLTWEFGSYSLCSSSSLALAGRERETKLKRRMAQGETGRARVFLPGKGGRQNFPERAELGLYLGLQLGL